MTSIHQRVEGHRLLASTNCADQGPEYLSKCECGTQFDWEDRFQQHVDHVLAESWDEGVRTGGRYGHEDGWGFGIDPFSENPYRKIIGSDQ